MKHSFSLFKVSFFLGLCLLPFFWWPWTRISFEVPKVWLFWGWVDLLFLELLVLQPKLLKQRILDKGFLILVGAWLIWLFLSSLMGANFSKSWWGNPFRLDGLMTVCHLIGLSLWVQLCWQKSWEKWLVAVLVGTSTLLSGWLVINGLATGLSFGQPNFLAGYLLVTLPWLLWAWHLQRNIKQRWAIGGVIGLQVVAIVLTQSFGSLLGVVLLGVSWLLLRYRRLGLSLLLAGIMVVFFLASSWLYYRDQFNAESRDRILTQVISGSLKRPLSGWGWANVDYAFQAGQPPLPRQHDIYVDKAHSHLLEMWATTGLIGLVGYVAIWWYLLSKLKTALNSKPLSKTKPNWWWIAVATTMVVFLFHTQTNIVSINEELLFWILVGIIFGTGGLRPHVVSKSPVRQSNQQLSD